MRVGDVVSITGGKYSCQYLVVVYGPVGYELRRVMKAKTKADNNRFPETMQIIIKSNTQLK